MKSNNYKNEMPKGLSIVFRILVMLIPFGIMSFMANAQYAPVPVTGFNNDIVADLNGSAPSASTSSAVDGTAVGSFVFVTPTYQRVATTCVPAAANGWPSTITSSNITTNTGITYSLQSATANNTLELSTTSPFTATGTLNLVTPVSASSLYIVCLGGAGATTFNVQVNFSDATNYIIPGGLSAPDWCGGAATNKLPSAAAPQIYYRMARNAATCPTSSTCQYLYELPAAISAANYGKTITSITFTATSANFLNVVAVGMQAPCTTPNAPPSFSTALSANGSISSITGVVSAASPVPTGYLVVRYPQGAAVTAPVNTTSYSAGQPLGLGTVVQSGASTSITASGLTGGTAYDFYVYSFNNTACGGGPLYSSALPSLNVSTAPCGTMSGIIPVGPGLPNTLAGGFTSLTNAITYINANGLGGNTVLELQSGYVGTTPNETFPITFSANSCINSSKTLTIRPAAGVNGLVIGSSNATATIDFNGGTYVTFDGRPGGTGVAISLPNVNYLSIVDSSTAGVAIRMINEAQNNTITYCDLRGQNTVAAANPASTLSGVIYIGGTTGANGNDFNAVSNCNIHSVSASVFPAQGIVSNGATTTAAIYNDNGTISGNNIYDYFLATGATAGVNLSVGNTAWTVSGNSLFQTASRTFTTAASQRGFWITPNGGTLSPQASGFIVTGNFIGGSAPNCGGAAWTLLGTIANQFFGMDLSTGNGTATSVQNNTIQNIALTTTSTAVGNFSGIVQAAGNNNIGTVTGNLIGSTTNATSILVTENTSSGGTATGIRIIGGTTVTNNVANNTICGIATQTGAATISCNINGILITGGVTVNVTGNTIGNTTLANAINATAAVGTTIVQSVIGINVTGGTTVTINNNTVANMNNAASNATVTTASLMRGIVNTTAATTNIDGNTIFNLSSAAPNTGSGSASAIVGISNTGTFTGMSVSGNTIYGLKETNASTTNATQITALYWQGSTTGTNPVNRNLIYNIGFTAINPFSTLTGIDCGTSGLGTFTNNMVRLGYDFSGTPIATAMAIRGIQKGGSTANIWYNSVYIGGSSVGTNVNSTAAMNITTVVAADNVVDNIFDNVRQNASTGGSHYAINIASATTLSGLNYNLYQYAGVNGSIFALNNAVPVSAYSAGWRPSDVNSVTGDPQFVNPTTVTPDLHLNASLATPAEGAGGVTAGTVLNDYDNQLRASFTPIDIGADADNFIGTGSACSSVTLNAGSAVASNNAFACPSGGSATLSLTGTNFAGVYGLSYQWQSRTPAGSGTFTNIAGANFPTFSGTYSAPSTEFQCVVTCSGGGSATSNPITVTPPTPGTAAGYSVLNVTGFNADVIANGSNGAGNVPTNTTTFAVDGGSPAYYFYDASYSFTGSAFPPVSLPVNGQVVSQNVTGLLYKLQPASNIAISNTTSAGNNNNVLQLKGGGGAGTTLTGTLTLTTPQSGTAVYLLATTGSGAAIVNATVTFSDNSTQVFNGITIPDWFNNTPFSQGGFGRVSNAGAFENAAGGPRMYDVTLALSPSNYSKLVQSITVVNTNGTATTNIANIFAVTMAVAAPTPFCGGLATSVTLFNPPSGATFQWQSSTTQGGPYSNVVGGSGATTTTYTNPSGTGTIYYVCNVTCTSGGLSALSSEVVISINPIPAITVTPTSATYCSSSAPVSITASGTAQSYTWSPSTGLNTTAGATVLASPSVTTIYTVTGVINSCFGQGTSTITNTSPTLSAGTSFSKTCTTNQNGATIGEANDATATYSWSPATGLSSTSVSNPTANPSVTTTYTVTKTTTSSGCTKSATVTATVDFSQTPAASVSASVTNLCNPGSSILTASGTLPSGIASYTFASSSGTFTPLSGGTNVSVIQTDDAASGLLPIGFNFAINGTTYSQVYASSNGILTFGSANSSLTNSLASGTGAPIIAPLWDDLQGANGTASYLTTGSAGSRVFTFEWLNWRWYYLVLTPTISFQVKLYEADNRIEFKYQQESTALGGSESASIGIAGAAGTYKSLNGTGASPTSSSVTETTTLNAKPATGQVYTFTPPVASGLSFSWSPATFLNATTGSPVTASGVTSTTTYTVTVANGVCSSTSSVTLTVAPLAISAGSSILSGGGCSGSTYQLSTNVSGGGQPYSYSWAPATGLSSTSVSNPVASPSVSTTYTVTVTDACNTTLSSSTTINVVSSPSITNDMSGTCTAGDTLRTVGTPPVGVSWFWQSSATGTSTAQDASFYQIVTTNGIYYVRAYNNATACFSTANSIVVNNFILPSSPPNPLAANNPTCNSTTLTVASPPSGVTYYWETIPNGTSTAQSTATPYTVTTTGTYYVRALDNTGGCWSTGAGSLLVNIYQGLTGNVTATQITSCANPTGLITPNVSGAGTVVNNDFTSSTLPSYMSISGNAAITGGKLRLTDAINSQAGGVLISNPTGLANNDFQIDFDFITTSGGVAPADGLSYSYGDDVLIFPPGSGTDGTGAPFAENGSGTKLKLSFDAINNTGGCGGTSGITNGNVAGVYLMYNLNQNCQTTTCPGVLYYGSDVSWRATATTGATTHVTIKINALGQVSMLLNNVVVVNNVQLPASYLTDDKSTWKHAFAARTGGLNEGHYIDNLIIQYNNFYEYSVNGGPYSTNNPIIPSGPGTYNVDARYVSVPSCSANLGSVTINTPSYTTNSTASTYCTYNTPPTLSFSPSYTADSLQWESSPAGANTWTAIPGANSSTYSPPSGSLLANTDFRIKILCGGSPTVGSPSSTFTMIVEAPVVIDTIPGTRCGAGSVDLGANVSGGATAMWYTAASGGTAIGSGSPFSTPTIFNTTTFYVSSMSGSGCESGRKAVIATVTTSTPISVSPATTICESSSTVISASSTNDPNYVYTWNPGGVTGANYTVSPSVTTTYTVTAHDNSSNCQDIKTVTISVNQRPTVNSLTSSPAALCQGDSGQISLTTTPFIPPSGNYTVTSIPFSPVSGTMPNAGPAAGDETDVTAALGFNFNYFGNTYSSVTIHSNGEVLMGAGNTGADFVYLPPAIPNTAAPNNWVGVWADLTLSGSDVTWGVVGVAPYRQLVVNFTNVNYFTSTTPFITFQTVLNETYNTIDVHLTSTNGTVGNTRVIGVENSTGSLGTTAPGRAPGTWSASNESWEFAAPVASNLLYSWSPSIGLSSTSVQNPKAAPNTNTTYTVTVNETGTGCSRTATLSMNVSARPQPYLQEGDSVLCSNDQGFYMHVLDNSAYIGGYPSGTTFDFYGAGAILYQSSTDNSFFNANNSDAFYAVVTLPGNLGSCTAVSDTSVMDFGNAQAPQYTLTADSVRCYGESSGKAIAEITFGGTPRFRWQWYNSSHSLVRDFTGTALSDTLSGLPEGMYTFVLTDHQDSLTSPYCSVTDSIFIGQPEAPLSVTENMANHVNVLCNGSHTGEIDINATGGTASYSYNWSNGSTTQDLAAIGAGTYTVTVTDIRGCTTTLSVIITQGAPIALTISGNTSICAGNSTTLNAGSGYSNYAWSTGATIQSISVNTAGTFTVTVTIANGCTKSASVNTTLNANPTPAITGSSLACATTPLNAGAGYNNYLWSNGATTQILNASASGTYTVTVTNASGCTGTASKTVSIVSGVPAQPGVISGPSAICKNSNGTFSIAAVPGATSYTWTATSGASVSTGQGSTTVVINFSNTATSATLSVVANNICGSGAARTFAYIVSSVIPAAPATINGQLYGLCNLASVAYNCPVVPNATSYLWTVPAGATVLTGQGTNSITVKYTSTFTGAGTISVVAQSGCGSSAATSRTLNAKPDMPVISGQNWACKNQPGLVYSVAPIAGATSYTWTVVAGSTLVSGQGTTSIVVNWGSINGVITCKANNSCGSSLPGNKAVSFTCKEEGSMFDFSDINLYPNPASTSATIQFEAYTEGKGQLFVYNLMGQQLLNEDLKVLSGNNQFNVDLNAYPKGSYIVKVVYNGFTRNCKLIVD